MDAVKAEKASKKKASTSNAEDMKKMLAELTAEISLDTSVEVEELEMEEEFEEEVA